ncbi:hypothetical protein GCM10023317_88150 [Actinopolymorpha pittospori]
MSPPHSRRGAAGEIKGGLTRAVTQHVGSTALCAAATYRPLQRNTRPDEGEPRGDRMEREAQACRLLP